MPQDIQAYVERLRQLRATNLDAFNKSMESYRSSYPDFYNQLVSALNVPQVMPQQAVPQQQPSAPDISVYVERLRKLRMDSLNDYNKTMEYYKSSNPVFYNQLVAAMQESSKVSQSTSFKMFLSEYKFYLIAIGAGVGVIIYLLTLLFNR